MLPVNNLLTQWETEEENRTRDQSIKNLLTNEADRKENRKIINIVDEKTFQPGLRTRKEKPRVKKGGTWFGQLGTWIIRDLDDKGLGQNKVLYNSSRVELSMVKLPLQAPQRSLRQGDRSPASCRLLALESH